jgi:hypothetical protein
VPNSDLGQAFSYFLSRWEKFTLFLRKPGAPLDNNAERALKMTIRHRKASLFYRSLRGAHVGDVFMSLIHTAERGFRVLILRRPFLPKTSTRTGKIASHSVAKITILRRAPTPPPFPHAENRLRWSHSRCGVTSGEPGGRWSLRPRPERERRPGTRRSVRRRQGVRHRGRLGNCSVA